MAHAFAYVPGREAIVGRMQPVEVELVLQALTQTRELLGSDEAVATSDGDESDIFAALNSSMQERPVPSDPALRRLLPEGSAEAEGAAEFRRLSEDSIRRQKQSQLDAAIVTFTAVQAEEDSSSAESVVELTASQARSLMMALTDVRLVLAQRLGIHTDEDAEDLHRRMESIDLPETERDVTAMYYDFMTWLSESITLAYLGRPRGK